MGSELLDVLVYENHFCIWFSNEVFTVYHLALLSFHNVNIDPVLLAYYFWMDVKRTNLIGYITPPLGMNY